VLDLTDGIAGAYADKLLIEPGARVRLVEGASGCWGAARPQARTLGRAEDGSLGQFLSAASPACVRPVTRRVRSLRPPHARRTSCCGLSHEVARRYGFDPQALRAAAPGPPSSASRPSASTRPGPNVPPRRSRCSLVRWDASTRGGRSASGDGPGLTGEWLAEPLGAAAGPRPLARLQDLQGLRRHHDELDVVVADWLAGQEGDDLTGSARRSRGQRRRRARAGRAATAPGRGFFERLDHAVLGPAPARCRRDGRRRHSGRGLARHAARAQPSLRLPAGATRSSRAAYSRVSVRPSVVARSMTSGSRRTRRERASSGVRTAASTCVGPSRS
jgi:hypothetical protein